jgi:uncharacterized protein (TIGR02611 family)
MSRSGGRTTERSSSADAGFQPSPPRWLRPMRNWVRRLPGGALIWKLAIGVIGAAVIVLGLLLIPLPGPGWAIVFLGLGLWATEFHWAHRVLSRARIILRQWTGWVRRQSLLVRLLIGLIGLVFLAAVIYLSWHFLL